MATRTMIRMRNGNMTESKTLYRHDVTLRIIGPDSLNVFLDSLNIERISKDRSTTVLISGGNKVEVVSSESIEPIEMEAEELEVSHDGV